MNFNIPDVLIQSAEEREERDPVRILQQCVTGRIMIKLGIRTTVQGWVFTKHIRRLARTYIEESAVFASLDDGKTGPACIRAEKIKAAEHLISSLEGDMPWIRAASHSDSATVDWLREPSFQIVSHELSLYRIVKARQQKVKEMFDKREAEMEFQAFTASFSAVSGGGGARPGNE